MARATPFALEPIAATDLEQRYPNVWARLQSPLTWISADWDVFYTSPSAGMNLTSSLAAARSYLAARGCTNADAVVADDEHIAVIVDDCSVGTRSVFSHRRLPKDEAIARAKAR